MIQLAAFLGNPGRKYEHNRHNVPWILAEALPFYSSLSWQKKFKGQYACYSNEGQIHLLKPETYMNLSGESVQAAAAFYKINIENIIVVHDELELPLGTISLKFSGGLGGHNGLRSMKQCFGSADFWRLRIGIGRPDSRLPGEGGAAGKADSGIVDWVLTDFSAEELEKLKAVFESGTDLLMQTFSCDPETLLNDWKKKVCNERV
ncbi:MAG: aminoacyl-tRNA hydrolase [Treponema sp.]|jgi:PTH1 family peptidyl-tRNA hydrolase|nr:aminoacyl-tRNA hydrolase [Treponema sp.]